MCRIYPQLIFFFVTFTLLAQQDEQISFYQYNQVTFNPSYAGMKGRLSCAAISRFQWVNFSGAPSSQWLSVHSSILKNRIGIGTNVIHDKIGMRGRTGVNLCAAGGIKLNENEQLRLGLSVGLDQFQIDFSNAIVNDQNDALATTHFSTTRFNAGLGFYYGGKKFNFSFSIPRIFPKTTMSNQNNLKLYSPHYYLSGSREFEINAKLQWRQSVLLKYVRNAPITIDINSTLIVQDHIHFGVLYRIHEAIGIFGLLKVKEQLNVGYNYDFPINGLLSYQKGTHEVLLQFELKEKTKKESEPKF